MNVNLVEAFRENFRLKLTLSIGLVLLVVLSLYLLFFIQQLTRTLDEGLIEQGENLARDLGFAAELGVLAGDPTFVDASITGIAEEEEIVFAAVYNKDGNLIASRGALDNGGVLPEEVVEELGGSKEVVKRDVFLQETKHYEFFAPVVIRTTGISGVGEVIGFTQVVVSLEGIREKQGSFVFFYVLVSFLIFLGAGAVAAYATRRITRSVDALMFGVQSVAKGRLGKRIGVGSKDEFGRLASAFNDMTDRLEEAKKREEEVSRMKSEFLSITAHQLRTPLSALKWVLRMSLEGDVGKLNKGQREWLEKGYDANERMITLVNDLLDVVRIEEGRFDYKFRNVQPEKLLGKMVDDIKIIAEQEGVEVAFHKPSRAIPQVSLDAEKFRLAFMNILDNAIQYTPKGGRVDVEITWQDEILVVVRDTGIGVPEKQRARLFTKFFRAANAVRMQTSGSGLGLFISKNIIEKHGGKVWIESEEGKGTSVYFTIPVSHIKNS